MPVWRLRAPDPPVPVRAWENEAAVNQIKAWSDTDDIDANDIDIDETLIMIARWRQRAHIARCSVAFGSSRAEWAE